MKRSSIGIAALVALSISAASASAQTKSGVDKLYILNCGEGIAGDISRWSPGVDVGKSMPMAENCYLMHHAQGWLLWDTGVTDAIAAMPNGQAPSDPRAIHWYRPKTLAAELDAVGVKSSDIKYLAISHTHPDHVGNVEMFPQSILLVQKAEYEWPNPLGVGRFKPEHPVKKLEGDYDVFGDGSVVILSTPGHTPGHQSLVVDGAAGRTVIAGQCIYEIVEAAAGKVAADNMHDEHYEEAGQQSLERLLALAPGVLVAAHDTDEWRKK